MERPSAPAFPTGSKNIFLFTVFNALSFQIILSSPMVLFAKSIGASATVLGLIAGMMPMLVIFQIPAAKHVERVGYKRFIYAGWGMRVIFIIGMSLVPLLGGWLDRTTQLALLLMLLFAFNLSRGISSCAWLPWITSIIPNELRGKYLLREAACLNVGSFAVFLIAAAALGTHPRAGQFAALFFFSVLMGATSLTFIKRISEPERKEVIRASNEPIPWLAIFNHPPFKKMLAMLFTWALAYGGLNTFIVAFLKTETGLAERNIMLVNSTTFLGGLSSLWFLGTRLDRLGSKPVLTFSMCGWIGLLALWIFISGKIIAPHIGLVVALQFLMGLAASLVSLSTTKLAMATVPHLGRSHFFALYSVVGNLTLGLSPVFWGLCIDAARSTQIAWHGFEWNRYSLFFSAVAAIFLVTLVCCRRLDEPHAASLEELLRDLWGQSPLRAWLRLWPRS